MTGIDPVGTGVWQHVPGEAMKRKGERLDEAVRVAEMSGDHVWVAIVSHLVVDPEEFVRKAHLDAESVTSVGLGCYVCEEPYDARLRLRRCPGEPKR